MFYEEIKGDLFNVEQEYYLAHAISSDAKMGAGIAVQFGKRFDYVDFKQRALRGELEVGKCYMVDGRTLNLVTKELYWHKPTYKTIESALLSMRELVKKEGIQKIAMPKIGAGLNKKDWKKVKQIIEDVFEGEEIEIKVYYI